MKVRSKRIYEAVQITEGMCKGEESAPSGLVHDVGESRYLYFDHNVHGCWFRPGDWFVADQWPPLFSDAEFREEFEEAEE